MNRQETTQIITLLAGNYSSISEKTREQKQIMLNTWYECLNDLDYNIVLAAVKKTIIESEYPPTIHEIRKNVIELTKPQQNDALKDWSEAYNMICNGAYMTPEEFDEHSAICRKFFGSVNQLRAYAMNTEFNLDVVRSNFLKQHEILSKRQREFDLLPSKMQNIVTNLVEKMDIKQLN